MRQKFFIFSGLIVLGIVLVGLNVASYVQKEKVPDNEAAPNRSTYNTGSTGTRAFFDLLNETGRKSVRWQEPTRALLTAGKNAPQTFVVIGNIQREFTDDDVEHLLDWVYQGGKLVLIDREPQAHLLSTTANWSINAVPVEFIPFGIDPSNQPQMTDKVNAAKPVQPSLYTRNVNAVQPSRFASSVNLEFFDAQEGNFKKPAPTPNSIFSDDDDEYYEPPPPAKTPARESAGESRTAKPTPTTFKIGEAKDYAVVKDTPKSKAAVQKAPVVHLANQDKILLVDFPYGSGKIVFLTDPYLVSNAGISLVDNAQLAINAVAAPGGTIAFDEFHQGYGANQNRLLAYFDGTPVAAIMVQIILLIGVVLFTQSRRFARPLPANEPNRLSKLEYVAAMAELQQRTRAYDLAMENIYSEFRRTMARFVGVDNFQTPRHNLARLIAEKTKLDAGELENLMFKCEEIIHGEPTSKKEVLHLTSRLREIEEKLGLKRQRTMRKGM